ncbi:GNAT family N-acetyltransferase [Paenibacillus sp. JCM 10914]|uniref:GNAT family N-acetyltransferase n=1 Tax=Paenibacillus sp. JCM 10914 TaxID=1236974 RepID=UPI000A5E6CFA|nr:hypothetical protein [Paenibacillus sp. JCM 10914]
MRFFIRALEPEEHEAIHLMIQEMGSGENGFVNSLYSRDLEEFQGKLNRYYEMSQGIGLAEGLVPQTTYWFYDGERPVGYGKLRHRLNDNLLVHGGISVMPSVQPTVTRVTVH